MVCRSAYATVVYRCFWWNRSRAFGIGGLELHHEVAERRPVRHALAPLPGAEAVGSRRRGRRGEALHHAALVAAAAGAGGRVVLRLRRRRRAPVLVLVLGLLLLLRNDDVLLPDAEVAGGPDDLRGASRGHY